MAHFVSGGQSSVEHNWTYKDNRSFNLNRASWLIDNYRRPGVVYRDGRPAYEKMHESQRAEKKLPALSPGTVQLFPQHTYNRIPKMMTLRADGSPERTQRQIP